MYEPLLKEPAAEVGGLSAGVLGDLLEGESGLGSDCRSLGRNMGLGARAPGPTDCENFIVGVSRAFAGAAYALPVLGLRDGVVGVSGNESDVADGEALLEARCKGKKIPEPGIDVLK